MDKVDYYELLGVPRQATAGEIKTAYRALAKVMHPDAGGTDGTFRLLRTAYETLTDPDRRAGYDRAGRSGPSPAEATTTHPEPPPDRPDGARRTGFGAGAGFAPDTEPLTPETIPWWDAAGPDVPSSRVSWRWPACAVTGWLVLLVAVAAAPLSPLVQTVWLVLLAGMTWWVARTVRRFLAERREHRGFTAEFAEQRVFGSPGDDRGETGERLTADLLGGYLTRLPGVRIFHGLAWPGSRFADIDHAVLCGRRLVLIESKQWLPGRYAADGDGTLWRNGHVFRGGHTRLAAGLAAYRELLPDLEIRGALIVYPSRAGVISTEDSPDSATPPLTPARFVHDIGGWLAAGGEPLDRAGFRTVLAQVVS